MAKKTAKRSARSAPPAAIKKSAKKSTRKSAKKTSPSAQPMAAKKVASRSSSRSARPTMAAARKKVDQWVDRASKNPKVKAARKAITKGARKAPGAARRFMTQVRETAGDMTDSVTKVVATTAGMVAGAVESVRAPAQPPATDKKRNENT